MLQIDHVYEFLYQAFFKDFELSHLKNGVIQTSDLTFSDISIFTPGPQTTRKIFLYDQEPFINKFSNDYIDMITWENKYTLDQLADLIKNKTLPYGLTAELEDDLSFYYEHPECVHKKCTLVTSEISPAVTECLAQYNLSSLYYFFHGFAALDWYRGYYALNFNKPVIRNYKHDFISFNRIITNDRSYRIYFISQLAEANLLSKGLVSFNVTDNLFDDWRDETADPNSKLSDHAKLHIERNLTNIDKLVIDSPSVLGSTSANIIRNVNSYSPYNDMPDVDSFWHVVTETVFYYNKLHLTEKIFKPIVMKQPFMLLAAPGNLEYLRSYGFKTFEGIIDERYDQIKDNDRRVEAVVDQLNWYCNLSEADKQQVIRRIEPIVEHNFNHFYGEFKEIIARELLDNTKTLFNEIGYDDTTIAYESIFKILVN